MKIYSRPQQDDPVTLGSGSIDLRITPAQLELITALVYNCRLGGSSPYAAAAFELITLIDEEFGTDFMDGAADDVDIQATIEDDQSCVILSTKSGNYFLTLEV